MGADAGRQSILRPGCPGVLQMFPRPRNRRRTCPTPYHKDFVIGNGDMLNINVWKQPDISRAVPVRSDGKISLPLIGDVAAAGQTPAEAGRRVRPASFKPYLAEPEVTVIVEQINSQKFNILGRVTKPGSYPLMNSTTVSRRHRTRRWLPRLRQAQVHLHSAPASGRNRVPRALSTTRTSSKARTLART